MKNPLKTKLMLILAVFITTLLSSCRDKIEVFQITRIPTFSFSYDNLTSQYADEVDFYKGKTVIHYYDDGSSEVLNRYLITANGTNTAGRSFTVNIEFDTVKDGEFIGIYRPQYQKSVGGIYSFNYVEKVSGNTYKSYDLDPSSLGDDFIRVERQNMDEKLVLGDFFAKVQQDQNPNEKIIFYQGIFKDLSYVLQ
jgi:hypothetical protein